jgi:hypothetical protein
MLRRPWFLALLITAVGLVLAMLPTFWHLISGAPAPAPAPGAPWQVALPAPGRSEVFGLRLPGSTLGEARARWGDDVTAAVLQDRDGRLALEAYVERFDAGPVQGRLLLTWAADATALARWREGLPAEPTPSGGRRHALGAEAWADLAPAGLVGLSFIPAAQLDAEVLVSRFGEPAERLPEGEHRQHWLYPPLGLAVVLDGKGRELLQYVAPQEFEARLAAPLRAR